MTAPTFTIISQGGQHVLRESEYVADSGLVIAVAAERTTVRLSQSVRDGLYFSQVLPAALARALAAELLACADALDAVVVKRGGVQ